MTPLGPPYGATRVHVIEVEQARTPRQMADTIAAALRRLEEASLLVQGAVAVTPGSPARLGLPGTVWLYVTTKPGPPHPPLGYPDPDREAMLERLELAHFNGESRGTP